VIAGDFLVALDVQASAGASPRSGSAAAADARIRLASRVEREWLAPTAIEQVHRFDANSGSVKATLVERYDALVLSERAVVPEPEAAAALLADAWLARGPLEADERVLRRVRFAGVEVDLDALVRGAALGARTIGDITVAAALPRDVMRRMEHDAPDAIVVPSGRNVALEYAADGSVSASVKLQELFGLGETPRIGPRREPVLLALLAPNGRPVQLTRDLRSFWDRTYPEVRKELRGRYPKHPWPEDPWNAPPTRRATPRKRN
jgi:ATP-dependent helicase HrpB